jgi:hypothetical protein
VKAVYEIQCAFFMSTFKSVARKFEYSWSKTRTFQGGPELNLEVRNGHLQRFHGEIHAKENSKKKLCD